ncbi:MAG: hypothetical protein NVSMB13_01330 [Mycobacteriales bacterium]
MALLAVAALLSPVAWSVTSALRAPGTDSVAARLAEWARGHGGSPVVNQAERLNYRLHPPKVGGAPAESVAEERPPAAAVERDVLPRPSGRPANLTPVVSPVAPPLPGEGDWEVLVTSAGRPAVQAAYVRPDSIHTSYLAGIARIDQRVVRFELHPGTQEPGHGPWEAEPLIHPDRSPRLLAVFNSGFRLAEARGGYYAEGRTITPLRPGAASLVLRKDGTATVGVWDRDVSMGSDVAAVRQNLALLVDGARVVPGIDANAGRAWGATLGNNLYVARSGVGITASGALVYVAGSSLSAGTLADLLQRAGCERAMELDINPEWTSFSVYAPAPAGPPVAAKLLRDMQRPANRYERTSTRDFVAVFGR